VLCNISLMTVPLPAPSMTKPPSSAEIAADYVRTLIFTGVLRPGDKVPVDEIALRIGISRQPVREALIEIADDGLVRVDSRRGTFVGAFGPQTVRDHYELMGLLQSFAVRRVAELGDAEVAARLRDLERRANSAADPGDRRELAIEVLRTINRAAGNTRLRMVMRSMSRFTPGDYYFREVPGAAEHNRKWLRAIIGAIEHGEPDRAADAAIEMSRRSGEQLIAHLRSTGVFAPDQQP
jgi:DNA-binding GntR family transcriptional regulator